MDDPERKVRYEQQTTDLYTAIGRFVVEFEQMCFAMSQAVLFALHSSGLKDQQLGNAVLAGLTAGPLREMTLSVLTHFYTSRSTPPEWLDQVRKVKLSNR